MAKQTKSTSEGIPCGCLNPVITYLEKHLITTPQKVQLALQKGKSKAARVVKPVPIMYSGGTIRPLADGAVEDIVEAIGFHNGKVAAVGSKEYVSSQMNRLTGGKYQKVGLLQGQTLLPGFIEPHVHIVSTALTTADWNDLGPFNDQYLNQSYNPDWLSTKIGEIKPSLPVGFWILGYGVDPSLMPFTVKDGALNVLQRFDCDVMDEIDDTVPIFTISASGHTAYVNTTALRKVYALGHTGFKTFAEFRDHVNAAGGLQEMEEMIPALGAIPEDQIAQSITKLKKGLDDYFDLAAKRGVTLLYDAAMSSEQKLVLDTYLALDATVKTRVGYAQLCTSIIDAQNLDDYVPMTEFQNVYRGTIKLVPDGSNQGLTGYQFEPYCCEPAGNTGLFNFKIEDFNTMVKTIMDKGWPIMSHGNGNKAIDIILTAYEAALCGTSGLTKRHRIEHCSLLDNSTLSRMTNLGISPSFLIGHVGYWGYVFNSAIFEEKALTLVRCKSALDKGMKITVHTDYFVSPLGPLRMMEQAITRMMEKHPKRQILNPSEKISPAQALKAVTYDAAWQCHAERWVGSLEVGKMADYVILGEDPITRKEPFGMRDIPILETRVGGIKL